MNNNAGHHQQNNDGGGGVVSDDNDVPSRVAHHHDMNAMAAPPVDNNVEHQAAVNGDGVANAALALPPPYYFGGAAGEAAPPSGPGVPGADELAPAYYSYYGSGLSPHYLSSNNAAVYAAQQQYYEARMRNHAVQYAQAAAGAAWAYAAQMAQAAAEVAASGGGGGGGSSNDMPAMQQLYLPPPPPLPPMLMEHHNDPQMALGRGYAAPYNVFNQQHPDAVHIAQAAAAAAASASAVAEPVAHDTCSSLGVESAPEDGGSGSHHAHPSHHHRHSEDEYNSERHNRIPRAAQRRQHEQQRRHSDAGHHHGHGGNSNNYHDDDCHLESDHQNNGPAGERLLNHHPRPSSSGARGRVRRHYDIDSSSSGGGSSTCWRGSGNGRRRQHHHHRRASSRRDSTNKKAKSSDTSLVGKTAISALYEWSSKRGSVVNFVQVSARNDGDSYEFAAHVDDTELARGQARSKGAAKQITARKALQVLLPGVVFDANTGMLLQLPDVQTGKEQEQPPASGRRGREDSELADDLAPNLAKRLAIGPSSSRAATAAINGDDNLTAPPDVKRSSASKRALDIYPGTSTTSEDEDENTYYASRGASVCSALLHAMVQIDSRLTQPPTYAFDLSPGLLPPPPPPSSDETGMAGAARKKASLIRVHRGSFTCTARLKVLTYDEDLDKKPAAVDASSNVFDQEQSAAGARNTSVVVLEAVGTGGTKREARHVASAQLLALLFPECETMVEVKAAAEAVREHYAAAKARRQQRLDSADTGEVVEEESCHKLPTRSSLVLKASDDVELSDRVQSTLCMLLRGAGPKISHNPASTTTEQQKLNNQVDKALQAFNELDEEGRSRPEELSADDIGRAILRRADAEDVRWIENLFTASERIPKCPLAAFPEIADKESCWTQPTVILLLCRAVAAYDDPPLGCAVLTLGFSWTLGVTLHVAQIANQPHLPRERFFECLDGFAKCMNRNLDRAKSDQEVPANIMREVLVSYIAHGAMAGTDAREELLGAISRGAHDHRVRSSILQSVQEESELSESSVEKRPGLKRPSSKASKRTRVK